ncbi:tetratricopeptide repeat protein [Longimicrobium terrae]|uniref:Tetratricopeptide (TPR) repeat protein n=1 Tax=Longimicrobium terrae TaxID=1639882 RepID=A0A841H1L2_9BACT|nr:hypothetical protein [Longimicrobium terrae]MBB4637485.1 tetratricopeptide (TPR) repeat protein [Longimicrobium terrae]MBB6071883.1 tetratricopeptide (TPR) repeat protein [Longimicrobium terrae]NNC30431.1 hypothetical protein [Longimicrobium terrae]
MAVLEEDGTETGLVLWTSLRAIILWASVPLDGRDGLFPPGAADDLLRRIGAVPLDRELAIALTTLCAVLDMPATVNPGIVSLVCGQVSRWAEGRGRSAAALAYMVAAASIQPENGRCAAEVGRLAMASSDLGWADTWLRRAAALARRGKDWNTYGFAYLHLAEVHVRRDLPERAVRHFRTAARVGRSCGIRELRAAGKHGLARVLMEQEGRLPEAEKHARSALRAYGQGHVRLPDILFDLAAIWVASGVYGRAVTLLRRARTPREGPERRGMRLALLARAAAGARDHALYEASWDAARAELDELPVAGRDQAIRELERAAALADDGRRFAQAQALDLQLTENSAGAGPRS